MKLPGPVGLNDSTNPLSLPSTTTTLRGLNFGSVLSQALSSSNGYLISQLANIITLNSSLRLMGGSGSSAGSSTASLFSSKLAPLMGNLATRLASLGGSQSSRSVAEKMTAAARQKQTSATQNRHEFDELIEEAASRHGVDPDLVRAVVTAESDFDPGCVSSAGAMGLMQLMPETAQDLGVADPFDPAQNIDGGTRYLSQMLERFDGDLPKALAAYNWGPSNVERGGSLPAETRNYLEKVARFRRIYAQGFRTRA